MISKFFSTLGRIGHACSEFGNYFMSIQRDCFKSGRSNDCEGNPTLADAQRDFQEMIRPKDSFFIG